MAHTVLFNFLMPVEMLEDLKQIKERDGVSLSEQARRGLQLWIDARMPPAAKKGERTQKGGRRT